MSKLKICPNWYLHTMITISIGYRFHYVRNELHDLVEDVTDKLYTYLIFAFSVLPVLRIPTLQKYIIGLG